MGGGAEAPPEMMEEAATPLNGCLGRKNCSQFFVLARERGYSVACAGIAGGNGQKHKKAPLFLRPHIYDHFFATLSIELI
jgi:hypothetical protein